MELYSNQRGRLGSAIWNINRSGSLNVLDGINMDPQGNKKVKEKRGKNQMSLSNRNPTSLQLDAGSTQLSLGGTQSDTHVVVAAICTPPAADWLTAEEEEEPGTNTNKDTHIKTGDLQGAAALTNKQ